MTPRVERSSAGPAIEPLLFACDRCRVPRFLFTRLDREWVCSACWKASGQPFLRTLWETRRAS